MTGDPLAALRSRLGVSVEPSLLEQVFTHRSYAYEHGGLPTNERLEFLGDSVLGLVVTELLYREHPDLSEGQLAKMRSAVVNMKALASIARELSLGECVRLGRGEESTGGRDKSSILGDALEALLGAIYLQHGLGPAADVIGRLFGPLMAESASRGAGLDWKTSLQEITAAQGLGMPEYLVADHGPDHDKSFTAIVRVAGREQGTGEGGTKKEAEQRAAEAAFAALRTGAPADNA